MAAEGSGKPLDLAISALRTALDALDSAAGNTAAPESGLSPWRQQGIPHSPRSGRISATDQLSWWFRPATAGEDPWDSFFDEWQDLQTVDLGSAGPPSLPASRVNGPADEAALREPPTRRTSLRMLLDEPEEELDDDDAGSAVGCLYEFVHAIGSRDVESAMRCVEPDYSVLEDDHEIDADGLAAGLRMLLDSLHGWDTDTFLVEIPRPVLHPMAILVSANIHIDAYHPVSEERRSLQYERLAVFRQQPDRSWLISALADV